MIREYPRLSTTVIDAYVGPKIQHYLMQLGRRLVDAGLRTPQLFLMQSNGGLMRISLGALYPNQTLLSGPAAGVIAGAELSRLTRRPPRRPNRAPYHTRIPRRVRGARLVATARQRSARHVLSKAAAAGAGAVTGNPRTLSKTAAKRPP